MTALTRIAFVVLLAGCASGGSPTPMRSSGTPPQGTSSGATRGASRRQFSLAP
jgi:hypothetical protein